MSIFILIDYIILSSCDILLYMKRINDREFFTSSTIDLAKNLLGKYIVVTIDGTKYLAQISETEAYLGVDDSACHTYQGKRTSRTEPMWQNGGTIYVYLCYGMHYLLNIVSRSVDQPEAVLIRATIEAPGPAKLTKHLHIDKSFNGEDIIDNPRLSIFDDGTKYEYITAPRVGIDYATDSDRLAPLRYILKK